MGFFIRRIKKILNTSPIIKEPAVRLYRLLCAARYRRYTLFSRPDRRTVVFESFLGNSCGDSPRALFEAMCADERYGDYKKIWMVKDPDAYADLTEYPNTRLVKFRSGEYYRCYARAGYWITNYLLSPGITKRPGQVYVQTWHGTPMKKIGCDMAKEFVSRAERRRTFADYRRQGRMIDYLPSPSPFYTEKVSSAFRLGTQANVLEMGYPRNDALCGATPERCWEARRALGLPEDKRVILYAPTWRDDQHTAGVGYTYEPQVDFDRLWQRLGGDCVILFRAHYLVSSRFDFGKYHGFIRNMSDHGDINELFLASDLLVTDYSSVLFDYASLKRPMLFYMYDYENYKNRLRDFYFDIDELPGPVIREKCDISDAVRDLLEHFVCDDRYERFNRKYNPIDEPCSGRILREIIR